MAINKKLFVVLLASLLSWVALQGSEVVSQIPPLSVVLTKTIHGLRGKKQRNIDSFEFTGDSLNPLTERKIDNSFCLAGCSRHCLCSLATQELENGEILYCTGNYDDTAETVKPLIVSIGNRFYGLTVGKNHELQSYRLQSSGAPLLVGTKRFRRKFKKPKIITMEDEYLEDLFVLIGYADQEIFSLIPLNRDGSFGTRGDHQLDSPQGLYLSPKNAAEKSPTCTRRTCSWMKTSLCEEFVEARGEGIQFIIGYSPYHNHKRNGYTFLQDFKINEKKIEERTHANEQDGNCVGALSNVHIVQGDTSDTIIARINDFGVGFDPSKIKGALQKIPLTQNGLGKADPYIPIVPFGAQVKSVVVKIKNTSLVVVAGGGFIQAIPIICDGTIGKPGKAHKLEGIDSESKIVGIQVLRDSLGRQKLLVVTPKAVIIHDINETGQVSNQKKVDFPFTQEGEVTALVSSFTGQPKDTIVLAIESVYPNIPRDISTLIARFITDLEEV